MSNFTYKVMEQANEVKLHAPHYSRLPQWCGMQLKPNLLLFNLSNDTFMWKSTQGELYVSLSKQWNLVKCNEINLTFSKNFLLNTYTFIMWFQNQFHYFILQEFIS